MYGYVVMPEHVHLLVKEPQRGYLAQMLQALKQSVARTLAFARSGIIFGMRVTTNSTYGANANLLRS
jgi:REP element-mobilizing transposase RayT